MIRSASATHLLLFIIDKSTRRNCRSPIQGNRVSVCRRCFCCCWYCFWSRLRDQVLRNKNENMAKYSTFVSRIIVNSRIYNGCLLCILFNAKHTHNLFHVIAKSIATTRSRCNWPWTMRTTCWSCTTPPARRNTNAFGRWFTKRYADILYQPSKFDAHSQC